MTPKLTSMLFWLAVALSAPTFAATPVNVNKADAATIAKALDGVGPSKAAAIVAYREEHGPFKSIDDLSQVKGMGKSTLERNRSAILLQGDDSAAAVDKPAKGAGRSAAKKASASR